MPADNACNSTCARGQHSHHNYHHEHRQHMSCSHAHEHRGSTGPRLLATTLCVLLPNGSLKTLGKVPSQAPAQETTDFRACRQQRQAAACLWARSTAVRQATTEATEAATAATERGSENATVNVAAAQLATTTAAVAGVACVTHSQVPYSPSTGRSLAVIC
jgi:hypothetical protein